MKIRQLYRFLYPGKTVLLLKSPFLPCVWLISQFWLLCSSSCQRACFFRETSLCRTSNWTAIVNDAAAPLTSCLHQPADLVAPTADTAVSISVRLFQHQTPRYSRFSGLRDAIADCRDAWCDVSADAFVTSLHKTSLQLNSCVAHTHKTRAFVHGHEAKSPLRRMTTVDLQRPRS